MKKLMPLLTLAVAACGPAPIDANLKDLPSPELWAGGTTSTKIGYSWERGGSCYRIPAETRLTVNGEAMPLELRGDHHLSFDGASSCEWPSFAGTQRPADEPRTEYIVSDGRSRMRAVFLNLGAERRIRVNGQEQVTLRAGSEVDIEWLPATDQLAETDVSLEFESSGAQFTSAQFMKSTSSVRLEGNHIRFTVPLVQKGQYILSVYGRGNIGVEVCEGFSACIATMYDRINVPVVVE
ncbi:hypothetical protein [Archangium violaceum]|uniref:hypothetical protein n=1 Tax=Archangium violaceum TaxID=83451 RepID=UPI0036DF9C43